ncbi:MAG: hypothetical protein ABSA21_11265 [Candidatus Limnocylindrales bacterium]|jgi:hypothetical protein
MTAPTASWSAKHDEARDSAWAAWHRLGLTTADLLNAEDHTADPLAPIALALGKPMVKVAADLLEQMDEDLDPETRLRIIEKAVTRTASHAVRALVDSIADELAEPEPVPFDPPSAGTWLRCRLLPRAAVRRLGPQLVPEWDGCWHIFSGDLETHDHRTHEINGRALCGARLSLRSFSLFGDGEQSRDYVVTEDRPTVDACRTCARVATSSALKDGNRPV